MKILAYFTGTEMFKEKHERTLCSLLELSKVPRLLWSVFLSFLMMHHSGIDGEKVNPTQEKGYNKSISN